MNHIGCGPVRRWREGDILLVENNFIRMAYAVTDDPDKMGKMDWFGPRQIMVTFIDAEKAKAWK